MSPTARTLNRLRRQGFLAEAVEKLADAEYVRNGNLLARWKSVGHQFTSQTLEEWLAAHLILYTLRPLKISPEELTQLTRDLDAQYRSWFGTPAPLSSFP